MERGHKFYEEFKIKAQAKEGKDDKNNESLFHGSYHTEV